MSFMSLWGLFPEKVEPEACVAWTVVSAGKRTAVVEQMDKRADDLAIGTIAHSMASYRSELRCWHVFYDLTRATQRAGGRDPLCHDI